MHVTTDTNLSNILTRSKSHRLNLMENWFELGSLGLNDPVSVVVLDSYSIDPLTISHHIHLLHARHDTFGYLEQLHEWVFLRKKPSVRGLLNENLHDVNSELSLGLLLTSHSAGSTHRAARVSS